MSDVNRQQPPKKPIPSKRERVRKIKAIQTELEMKRRELGLQAPSMRKGPVFYLVLMTVLAVLGLSVVKATDSGKAATRVRNAKIVQAEKSVGAFAEALGRFKFHCGQYPTPEEGLEALALKRSCSPSDPTACAEPPTTSCRIRRSFRNRSRIRPGRTTGPPTTCAGTFSCRARPRSDRRPWRTNSNRHPTIRSGNF